ncbi:MAG: 30S ribosomal protein S6 [Candidatus Peribacteria bacterium]|jgi:ribosomal protein S6|nr:30S ribosomal protein S6 [Candidatus Peribacteria bacterium]
MTNYELLLILNPNLSEEERTASLDNLRALLKKANAKIEKEDIW